MERDDGSWHALDGLLRYVGPESQLRPVLEDSLATLTHSGRGRDDFRWTDSTCLLDDIGDFSIFAHTLVSKLVEQMIKGPHVRTYARTRAAEVHRRNHYDSLVAYINEKGSQLKCVNLHLSYPSTNPVLIHFAHCIRRINQNLSQTTSDLEQYRDPRSPFDKKAKMSPEIAAPIAPSPLTSAIPSRADRSVSRDSTHLGAFPTAGPSESEAHGAPLPVMDQDADLSLPRGTCHRSCPHGTACEKGGREPGGALKVFQRNSEYVYVYTPNEFQMLREIDISSALTCENTTNHTPASFHVVPIQKASQQNGHFRGIRKRSDMLESIDTLYIADIMRYELMIELT